ncbi:hypothetical protein C8J25_101887 [Sphingomonas faeni]|uniref:YjbR protein n=1 Tax=Sphingomonas faeni TaxID=185950 RepID=A0A2T5UD02_9SPHN|nr:MmcQ/YjbR family DNA-binding protein [Sphingomonas faeni]PTW49378.1 hypothetical protein C8J25_101887 [Sphingomonas faeni]
MKDWAAVADYALSLPETEASTSYGQPAIKTRGKMFVSTGHVDGSFHVRSPHDEKAVLIATDPDSFWQTAHYETWPGLLVRYGTHDPERVACVIARAWWDQASARQRKAYGDRP